MTVPALVVAGLRSGVGKTTVTLGLIRALADRGRRVAAFKVGPDFLDPSHYQSAGAAFVRNLDPILQTERGMRSQFAESSAYDAIIVEGVMGLFDGPFPGKPTASTADIARILGLPILLVCDGRSCAQSIAAEILGARMLLGRVPMAGVMLNFVGSKRHADLLVNGVERMAKARVAGCIYRDSLPALPHRHLGLVPAAELGRQNGLYAQYGKTVAEALPVDRFMRTVATLTPTLSRQRRERGMDKPLHDTVVNTTVGIAMDPAFSFYYPETIALFQRQCRQVIFFSPLNDRVVPAADLYYFGGGFPEVYAKGLSENLPFRSSLKHRLTGGARAYAECGGLMYLSREIVTGDGGVYPMVGAIPGRCVMHPRRQALGYWKARVSGNTLLLKKGMTLIGHEYHWSTFESAGGLKPVYESRKIGASDRSTGGWCAGNTFASYLHLSPLGNPRFFRRLLDWAAL